MKNHQIVLSIAMLISGRKEMKQSLDSLQGLMEAVPSELILVDTGCSKEYRELAEQYTDRILEFTWCNDFSAARNVGLQAAKGEWFLYLDDDEWFENPTEIIDFFKSGEYRNYNSAAYIQRNYFNRQATVYEDISVSRMIKKEDFTVFKGKIHEYLFPYMLPTKYFQDFVHHYGYIYKDTEERRKHSERNIKPLLEMIEEEPDDPRWVAQLAQEYFGVDRYDDTVETCKKGLDRWHQRKEKDKYVTEQIGALYGFMLIALETQDHYEEAEQALEEAFREELMPDATLAFFHFCAVRLYSKMKKYQECRDHVEKYLNYYDQLKDDSVAIARQTALLTARVFQDRLMYPALLMSMEALIRVEDKTLAKRTFYTIDWADRRMLYQNAEEKKLVDACCQVSYDPLWVELLQTLVSREKGVKEMYIVFLETEIEYKQQGKNEKLARLRHLVAELDYDHRYILYTKILWASQNPDIASEEERKSLITELFGQLFDRYGNEIFEIKTEVWNVADKMGISLESLLLKMDYHKWKRGLEAWYKTASVSELMQWDERLSAWKSQADIRYNLFSVRYLEGQLRQCPQTIPAMYQLEEQLWQYAETVLDFYGPYYKEFVWKEATVMLPEEAQLALYLQELQKARRSGTDQDVIRVLRDLTDVYPPLNETIAYYTKLYRQEVHSRNQEMKQLASTLKDKVRQLITTGNYAEAKAIIAQLEQFIPEDEELKEMKQSLE